MTLQFRKLDPELAQRCRSWTFPAYRHLLSLEPSVRYAERGDLRAIRPLSFAALDGDRPVGLALGCVPEEGARPATEMRNDPELLSVFVAPEARHQGVAAGLVGQIEEAVREAGFGRLDTVYMTGSAGIEFFERILARRRWSPPQPRMLVLKATMEEAMRAPWYQKYRRRDNLEFFAWKDLGDEELARLRESHEKTRWIAEDLVPWHHDRDSLEPASSIGIRLGGEIVGWVLNHPADEKTVRFTYSFIRRDLSRRGRIVPAYSESIRRAAEAGFQRLMFTVPFSHPDMVAFARRWCAPWYSFQAETRGSSKDLQGVAAASP